MALVAVLSPLSRMGAACARGADLTAQQHDHGADAGHGDPAQDHGHDGQGAADHCAATASCASSALASQGTVVPQRSAAHAAPAITEQRAPLALVTAPEPPPPRA